VPSSPDDVKVSMAGQDVRLSESSVVEDHNAEMTMSTNDSQVCCTDCVN